MLRGVGVGKGTGEVEERGKGRCIEVKKAKKKKELREQHGYHSYSWLESTFESHHLVLAVSFKYLRTER